MSTALEICRHRLGPNGRLNHIEGLKLNPESQLTFTGFDVEVGSRFFCLPNYPGTIRVSAFLKQFNKLFRNADVVNVRGSR